MSTLLEQKLKELTEKELTTLFSEIDIFNKEGILPHGLLRNIQKSVHEPINLVVFQILFEMSKRKYGREFSVGEKILHSNLGEVIFLGYESFEDEATILVIGEDGYSDEIRVSVGMLKKF